MATLSAKRSGHMDEAKLDELNRLHDAGKLGDDDYHALVRGEGAGATRPPMRARKRKMLIGGVVAMVVLAVVAYVTVVGIKPLHMSDAVYKAGRDAVQVGEDYKSGRISESDAADRLDMLYESAVSANDARASGATEVNNNNVTTEVNNNNVTSAICDMKTAIMFSNVGLSTSTSGTFDANLGKLRDALSFWRG